MAKKKRKSPLDILMDTIAEAEANITSASAELAYATGKRRERLLRRIDLAGERLADAETELGTGPSGLGASGARGVGLITGRPKKSVGGSTTSHRTHEGRFRQK
jgi:hypothetical protein